MLHVHHCSTAIINLMLSLWHLFTQPPQPGCPPASMSVANCQVRVYSGRESGQVWTKADEGREQRAGQEVSPAGVGDCVDSTTKDNER